jgi:tetratricopeptide (TPR) repeat protein
MAEKPAKMVVLLSNKTNNKKIIGNSLSYQAIEACLNQKFDEAIEVLEQVRQIGSDTNDLRIELRALNNIAGVYYSSKKFIQAEETLNKAIIIADKLELTGNVTENLYRLISIMDWKGDVSGMRKILERIGKLLEENPNSQFLADYLLEKIRLSISDTNFTDGLGQIEDLLELAMKTNRPNLIRSAIEKKASINVYLGNYQKALLLCEQVDELFTKSTTEDVLIEHFYNCFTMSRLLIKTGNTKKATHYFEKGSKILDSYTQANDNHKLERDLTRFTIDWHLLAKDKANWSLLNNKKKPSQKEIFELLTRVKDKLEQHIFTEAFIKRQSIEILLLFLDIIICGYKMFPDLNRYGLESFSSFASTCTDSCIQYFFESGTKLFKEDLLSRNNQLVQLRKM